MGYRGKTWEQDRAREMRASGMTLDDIASWLGVSKGSVSVWVRDVAFTPSKRRYGPRVRPNALMRRKQDEIAGLLVEGRERIGELSEREFLVAGAALYAGEGGKTDGAVTFPNSDPRMLVFFLAWLRHFFDIEESRLRLRLYLHEGLDLVAASQYWAALTGIPLTQHTKPYRAKAGPSIRKAKHPMGCPRVDYQCSRTHREIMGLVSGLLTCTVPSGVAQSAARLTVNQ
ncbi:MAG: hypothetical protein QOK28_3056 [Actinomycetota bacterium]